MFLNARPDSDKYFPCKILHRFKSFVDFFECRRGEVYGGRGDCSAGVVVDKLYEWESNFGKCFEYF